MAEKKQDAPIAEDLRDEYARCAIQAELGFLAVHATRKRELIERTSRSEQRERATNQRLDSMAHEPFNTPEELMQDLVRENSEFTNTIVELRERVRVLRDALGLAKNELVAPGNWLVRDYGWPGVRDAIDAALAFAPEQPAATERAKENI